MENIDKVLVKQNKHWRNKNINVKYVERDLVKKIKPESRFIEIVTGVRRSGKSTIFYILIDYLIKKKKVNKNEILFINFDNPNFIPFYQNAQNLDDIIEKAEVLTGSKVKYLFFDEIQNVVLWEKWVKDAYDQKQFKKIFITGSNSDLLAGKYISRLSGRYFTYTNFVFSFKEFLSQRKQKYYDSYIDNFAEKHKIIKLFDEYLKNGGFPEVAINRDLDIVDSYYQTILLKDVVDNNNVRDSARLKNLAYYLVSNCAGLFSYNKIGNFLKLNEKTVQEYIEYLTSSYLFFELKKFDYSVRKQNINKKKIYIADNSFINKIGFNFSANSGKYLENLVLVELLRRGGDVFYHNKNHECDFVVKKDNKIKEVFQVCYELNEKNRKREFDGLIDAMNEYNLKFGVIITRDQREDVKIENKKIKIIPAWEWLIL